MSNILFFIIRTFCILSFSFLCFASLYFSPYIWPSACHCTYFNFFNLWIFVLFTLYLTQCLSLYISVELLIIFEILSSSVSPSLQQIFCENIQYFVGIFKYFVGIFKYFVGILKYFVRIFKYSVGIFKYFVGIIKYFVGLFKYYVEILSRIVNSSPSIPTHVNLQ